ncbi:MAG: DUF2269 domain-containing protein [Rhodobacterales bacterium]|nr:DUF2269 domain-containing protein [Rhodobacterales bacterium]
MGAYTILKTLHVLSAIVLVGVGLGTAFAMVAAHHGENRRRDPAALALVARNVVLADWVFTTPAVIVQPLTGYLLMGELGLDWTEPWIAWAVGLYLFTGACWLPVVVIQHRLAALAKAAAAGGHDLPPAYHRLYRVWFALGWPAFAAVLAIVWLMVARPG